MQTLTTSDIQAVSGAYIRPSDWIGAAGAGMAFGAACFVVTAFSAHPVALPSALLIGGTTGFGLAAAYDILREAGW